MQTLAKLHGQSTERFFVSCLVRWLSRPVENADKEYCPCIGHRHLSKAVPGLISVKGIGWVKARSKWSFGLLLYSLSIRWLTSAVHVLEAYFRY